MNHTAGPWEYRGHWIYPVGSNDDVGRVSEGYLRPSEERDANGYLIAAAPQLLEALTDIVEQADKTSMMLPADLADSIRVFGRAAIKAAEEA